MSIRHWLISKLACGDMIVLNLEVRTDGAWQKRNLGPALIENCSFSKLTHDADFGLVMGNSVEMHHKKRAVMVLAASMRKLVFKDSEIRLAPVGNPFAHRRYRYNSGRFDRPFFNTDEFRRSVE